MRDVPMPTALATMLDGYRWTRADGGESGGAVYRLDADGSPSLYLKYGRGRVATEIIDEMARLAWLAGRLPAPTIRHFVASEDAAWLLTTALPGRTADDILADDAQRWPDVVTGAAAFMRRVHAIPVASCPFEAGHALRMLAARANIDGDRVDEDDFDDDHAGWTAADVWRELVDLVPTGVERVVTHGDFSLGNLLFDQSGVTGCIDVGRLGVADRYQDIAILWQNLRALNDAAPALMIEKLELAPSDDRRLRFHRCLDELF